MKGLSYQDIRKAKAIEQTNKKRFLDINPELNDKSGIYFLTRIDENDIKYAYIGQAKHVLSRLAQHLVGYQHIDLSLKKHGLYNHDKNPYGWHVNFLNFPNEKLDYWEQHYIKQYAAEGYQLRNKTAGGQGRGKTQIDDYRPSRGYRDGIKQGYRNASREVANLFEKHLNYSKKSDRPNKNQDKAAEKFEAFLNFSKSD